MEQIDKELNDLPKDLSIIKSEKIPGERKIYECSMTFNLYKIFSVKT